MWSLAAIALLIFVLQGLLQSRWAGAYFAGLVENGLEDLLGREVWVEAVHLKLLPLGVEVDNLRLGGPSESDPPFVTVARAAVDIELLDLQHRTLTIQEVLLDRPRLNLDFQGPGQSNLPSVGRKAASSASRRPAFRVNVRRLAVAGGELRLQQQRLPIELKAQALNAELTGGKGANLTGRVVVGTLELKLPQANPIVGAVGVRVVVGPEGLRILSGRVGAPDLTATVTGRATWPEKEWVFEVQGEGDSSFFERLGYLQDQIRGPFRVEGGFAWQENSWGFRAEVTSPSLDVFERRMEDVRAAVSGDRNGLRCDVQQALYALGSVRGSLNVETEREQRSFEVDLILDRLSLEQVAADQGIPLSGLSGRVSGVFNYIFPFGQAREGQGWADLQVEAEAKGREWIPVGGAIPLLIEKGVIRTQAARLTGPSQRIGVEGFYDIGERRGEFGYRLESGRVERLALLLPFSLEDRPLWLPTSGTGLFEGTLFLEPGRPRTLMHLDLEGVQAPGAAAERVRGNLTIGIDGLEDLRLELLRPDGGLIVTGSLPFAPEREVASPVPFTISVDAAGWPLDQIRPWVPMEIPVDGLVFGSLGIWGSLDDPFGQLRVSLRPAIWNGIELEEMDLRLRFDPAQIEVPHLGLSLPAGEIDLAGDIDRVTEEIDFEIRSRGLRMDQAPFSGLLPGGVSGELRVEGALAGHLEEPRLEADLAWQNLELADRRLGREGQARVFLTLDGGRLEAEGDLLGLVRLAGGGRVDAEGFEVDFSVSTSVLEELVLLTGSDKIPECTGGFEGRLLALGSFGSDRSWRAALELQSFDVQYQGLGLHNLEPVVIRVQDDRIHIDSLFVGEPEAESELFLNGTILIGDQQTLDLRLQSSLEANWVGLVLPDIGLQAGRFEVLATVYGSPDLPHFNGQGRLTEGRVVLPDMPFSIDDIDGVLLFDPDQILLDTMRGTAAAGTLLASGTIRPFESPRSIDYRLQVSARDLTVPYPEGWLSRGNADLILISTEGGRQIRGSAEVQRALYVQDVKLGLSQMLQGLTSKTRLEVERADDVGVSTELNIAVRGPGALRVRNNLADLHGDLEFVVRGTLSRPVVFGRVLLEPGGKLVLGPNEYLIERGTVRFANPFEIEPIFDIVAKADVREYDITLNLSGSLERLNATYASNPPLADLEILSLLATGEENWATGSSATGSGEGEAAMRATSLLYGQAASLVTQRTGQLFGLDRFRVQPLTSSSGELSSARVTVGKQLSRDVYATYSYDPATTEEQVFQIEWRVDRGLRLLLRQNGDESYGIDLVWQKTF